MSAQNRNKARKLHSRNDANNRESINRRESQDNVRENRQGFRGTGMFQLTRYYSQEGLLVVDLGGPPVVGR